MITLNNIISIFQDFAENKHKQIKSFRFGSIATENSEEVKYTVLWAKLAEPGAELDFQTDTFLFDILILDKPNINNEYKSTDRKSTRLNSSHMSESRMPSSA